MNRIALRILTRMLDALIEQTGDVAYAHHSVQASAVLAEAIKHQHEAKRLIERLMVALEGEDVL